MPRPSPVNRAASSEGESWSTIDNATSGSSPPRAASKRQRSQRGGLRALEVDEVPSTESGLSWVRRVAWLRGTGDGAAPRSSPRGHQAANINSLEYWLEYRQSSAGGGDAYFGGSMDSADRPTARGTGTGAATSPVEALYGSASPRGGASPLSSTGSFQRVSSWFSSRRHPQGPTPPHPHDEGSEVGDFQESEWTPPDSSYGAAIPVGGWIPKTIRRLIEWTLIGTVICVVAFLVISTSIRISGAGGGHSSSSAAATNGGGGSGGDDPYGTYVYGGDYNANDGGAGGGDGDGGDTAANATAVDDDAAAADDEDGANDDDAAYYDGKDNNGNKREAYNPDNDGSFFNYAYGDRGNHN